MAQRPTLSDEEEGHGTSSFETNHVAYFPSRAAHHFPQPINRLALSPSDKDTDTDTDTDTDIETDIPTLLLPIQSSLEKLRATTLPPFPSRVQMKSPAEVLKERLVPIGRYIVNQLVGEEEGSCERKHGLKGSAGEWSMEREMGGAKGALELDVW